MTEIALVADLHGNLPAVEALERDLTARRIRRVWCLGDMVGKGPSSAETLDWANSLIQFDTDRISEKFINDTMVLLLKDEDDFEKFNANGGAAKMLRSMAGETSED